MTTCPNCGVELNENANFCSLCGEPLLHSQSGDAEWIQSRKVVQEKKLRSEYQRLTRFQKRMIFWEISGLILLSGSLITFLIDLIGNESITWSKYPVTVSLALLINITLLTFWHKKSSRWLSLSFLTSSLLIILLDIYGGGTGWGMHLGIPLLLAAYITLFGLILMIRRARQKGLNIVAYSLITVGLLSVCTDGIISLYVIHRLHFNWSLIVLIATVMIAGLLLYMHYRMKKVTDLKRFFHI
jgi:hypothetical protein